LTGGRQGGSLTTLARGLSRDEAGYIVRSASLPQVPICAAAIVEPETDHVVSMLEALPAAESFFYSKEEHVIDITAKCKVHLQQITEQYAFYGGTADEVIKYFSRSNLPKNMWTWRLFSETKAIAVFSCILKKDQQSQRKLLMACPFNYLASDASARSNLGMDGAGALCRASSKSGKWNIAICDQSNAFSNVIVPEWMWLFQGTPHYQHMKFGTYSTTTCELDANHTHWYPIATCA